MEFLAISDKDGEQFQKVVPIKIGDSVCNPVFLCLHAKNPGIEQLRKDLSRYIDQQNRSWNSYSRMKIMMMQQYFCNTINICAYYNAFRLGEIKTKIDMKTKKSPQILSWPVNNLTASDIYSIDILVYLNT